MQIFGRFRVFRNLFAKSCLTGPSRATLDLYPTTTWSISTRAGPILEKETCLPNKCVAFVPQASLTNAMYGQTKSTEGQKVLLEWPGALVGPNCPIAPLLPLARLSGGIHGLTAKHKNDSEALFEPCSSICPDERVAQNMLSDQCRRVSVRVWPCACCGCPARSARPSSFADLLCTIHSFCARCGCAKLQRRIQ